MLRVKKPGVFTSGITIAVPRRRAGSSPRARRVAASMGGYSAAWTPALTARVGPGSRPRTTNTGTSQAGSTPGIRTIPLAVSPGAGASWATPTRLTGVPSRGRAAGPTTARRWTRSSHPRPSVDAERLARAPPGVVGGEEEHRRGDVLGRAQATQRDALQQRRLPRRPVRLPLPPRARVAQHEAGGHAGDRDLPRTELPGELPGEPDLAGLGAGVGLDAGEAGAPSRARGDVDDAAVPALLHDRRDRPAAVKGAGEVHRHDGAPLLGGHLFDRLAHLAEHAPGHVDQDVDGAFCGDHLLHHGSHLVFAGDVEPPGPAAPSQALARLRGRRRLIREHVDGPDRRPPPDQLDADRTADAVGGAGHQRRPPLEAAAGPTAHRSAVASPPPPPSTDGPSPHRTSGRPLRSSRRPAPPGSPGAAGCAVGRRRPPAFRPRGSRPRGSRGSSRTRRRARPRGRWPAPPARSRVRSTSRAPPL